MQMFKIQKTFLSVKIDHCCQSGGNFCPGKVEMTQSSALKAPNKLKRKYWQKVTHSCSTPINVFQFPTPPVAFK